MSLAPVFKIGLWNGWILWVLQIVSMIVPDFFLSGAAKARTKRAAQFAPFNKKKDKILAYSTHVVIVPISMICSIFLPLQTGTPWFYIGLVLLIPALVINIMTTMSFAATPVDQPVTSGIYRISRHPIYLNGFLFNLSLGIVCASWIILLCAVLWIVFFNIVIPAEESFLISRYGDAYRTYAARTPRWIGVPKTSKA